MFEAFAAFFRMCTRLFIAGEKGAIALDNVADVGVIKSEAFRDSERMKCKAELIALQKTLPSKAA